MQLSDFSSTPWKASSLGKEIHIRCGSRLDSSKRTDKQIDDDQVPVEGAGKTIGYTRERIRSMSANVIVIGRAGTVGKPRLIERECFVLDTAFWVTPKNNNDLWFLYFLLQNIPWKTYSHGSVLDGLRKSTINKIPCALPSPGEQEKISSRFIENVQNIQRLKSIYREKIQTLENLEASLLRHMFETSNK